MAPSGPLPAASDQSAELLRLLKQRKPEAVGQLYDRYGRLLFTLIQNIVGDREIAGELLLEVFVKASNRVQEFPDEPATLEPWLLVLARNHALSYRKGLQIREQAPPGDAVLEQPRLFLHPDPVEEARELPKLRDAFLHLPEQQRAMLEMIWCQGLSCKDIALKLGQSVSATRSLIAEALAVMRAATQ